MSAEVDQWQRDGERKQRRWALAGSFAAGTAVVVFLLVTSFVECNGVPAGDKRAIDAIEAQGFHAVRLGGADALKCDPNESSRHFSAVNSLGKRVEGTVCCGITGVAKGCTLRW